MACVFKRKGVGPWRIAYFDHDPKTGRKRRREFSTQQGDRAVAEQVAARLEEGARLHRREAADLAELRRRGLTDPVAERLAEHGRLALEEHLADFQAVMEGKGDSAAHVRRTMADCRLIIEACHFTLLGDLDAVAVGRWVSTQRPRWAPRTINRKLTALKTFTGWLWQAGRVRTDPLRQVRALNVAVDRRRTRRALTEDEIGRLLAAAEHGRTVGSLTGPQRAMLYRIALGTGLRRSELRSLTPSSFDLCNLGNARVAVKAAHSKHRRDDVLPIRRDLAERVARFIEGKAPSEPLFPTVPDRASEMLRVDLDAAKPWIPYRDAAGRTADFHALRTTAISRLARSGVGPAVAKELARHSSITQTIDHYTSVSEGEKRAALDKLPALPEDSEPASAAKRGTGTEG